MKVLVHAWKLQNTVLCRGYARNVNIQSMTPRGIRSGDNPHVVNVVKVAYLGSYNAGFYPQISTQRPRRSFVDQKQLGMQSAGLPHGAVLIAHQKDHRPS
jgi:hypothetical protein